MPDEAVEGFLRIQAEREFLLPPDDLALAVSLSTPADGVRVALLAALPARQYANLQRALHLVGLSSVVVVPAVTALADPGLAEARLVVSPRACDLLVTAGGGVVLLRRLANLGTGDLAEENGLDSLPGDVRISLRQLPAGVRGEIKGLTVSGTAETLGIVMPVLESDADHDPWHPQADAIQAGPAKRGCERLAALAVSGLRLPMALAPIPALRHRAWFRRWRPRHIVAAAAAVVALVLTFAGLVFYQRWQLAAARQRQSAVAPRAEAVRTVVAYAKSHTAWFSDQPDCLDVLRAVTLAFPERGGVWATRIEIKERRQVVIAGRATSREDWLRTLDALRQAAGVTDLRVTQARVAADGKSPMTFAVRFSWQPPAGKRTGGEATL